MMLKATLAVGMVFLTGAPAAAQAVPPALDVVEGACPFECCTYGRWLAIRSVELRSAPDPAAAILGRVEDGDSVTAETGQVHTVPTPFRVGTAMTLGFPVTQIPVEAGDTIWLLDYQGEGLFNAWVEGRRVTVPLDFSPFGGSADSSLGQLLGDLESLWWVRIRTPSGTTGWTSATDSFRGKDACAC